MATKRMLQLAEQIREHIALMLVRGEIADPRVRGVTLNSVKMSSDLQVAKIYFSVFGDVPQRKDAEKALKSAAGFIRRELGKVLLVRYIPALTFYYDDSVEHAVRIGALISKVSDEIRVDEAKRRNQMDTETEKLEENKNKQQHK